MLQIINMFLVVSFFWLVIEFIAVKISKHRRMADVIDPLNNKSQ